MSFGVLGSIPTCRIYEEMPLTNLCSRVSRYYRRNAASFVFRRPFSISQQQALISFTFDDFPRSALLTGGAILSRCGVAGTYYVSFGLLGKETLTGQQFVAEDLVTLFEQGHELGCHTSLNFDSWETPTNIYENSIVQNRTALTRLFPDAEFRTFSYPINPPRPLTKARIANRFLCCRGGGQNFNVGRVDLSQLSAYFLEKTRDDFRPVADIIDRNRQASGWLIFATHDISENHSQFGCTPEFFEQVVQYAISSGARILPVVKALEALGAPGCRQHFLPPG
jgi:hypothetical protein